MGKAYIYNELNISSPIKKVGLEKGVIDAPVREYLSRLSVVPSEKQINALQDFYKTLSDNGIWDTIDFCYPMFGSVKDCAIGLKGDKLKIPDGAIYDNGLNLEFATNGRGINKKGILIKQLLKNSNYYQNNLSLYYNSDLDFYGGDMYTLTSEVDNVENADSFGLIGPVYSSTVIRFDLLSNDDTISQPMEKGIVTYVLSKIDKTASTYMNGKNKKVSIKDGISPCKYLGINLASSSKDIKHLQETPINFYVGSWTASHTDEQVKILSDEITKLKEALFEL